MPIFFAKIIVLVSLFYIIASGDGFCPEKCTCSNVTKHKRLKVDCKKHGISKIPKLPAQAYELVLNENFLSEIDSFENLVHLEKLQMIGCDLTSLPDNLFTPLTALKSLDLSRNTFINIPNINSPSLNKLVLSNSGLTSFKFPPIFKNNVKLQTIVLSSNTVGFIKEEDLLPLKLLPVTSLKLSACELSSISSDLSSNLGKLNSLSLNSNKLTTHKLGEALSSMDSLKELRTLSLKNNAISEIGRNTFPQNKLLHLKLDSNPLKKINKDAFNNFRALKQLSLKKCKLVKVGKSLESLQNLNHLYLNNNPLETVPDVFPESIQSVDLSDTKITILKTSSFMNCHNLKLLTIQNAELQSIEDNTFMNTPNLLHIDLSKNRLSDVFLKDKSSPFAGLNNLEILILDDNGITKLEKSSFIGLKNLKNLSLKNNRISWWHLDTFKFVAGSLEVLDMHNNEISTITDHISNSFFLLNRLTTLDLSFNTFACDCAILRFQHWLQDTQVVNADEKKRYECASPAALKGTRLLSVTIHDCSTQLSSSSSASQQEDKHTQSSNIATHVFVVVVVILILCVGIVFSYVFRRNLAEGLRRIKHTWRQNCAPCVDSRPQSIASRKGINLLPSYHSSSTEIESIDNLIQLDVREPPCGHLVLVDELQSPVLPLDESLNDLEVCFISNLVEVKQQATEKWLSMSDSGVSSTSVVRRGSDAASDVSILCLDDPHVDALFVCSGIDANGSVLGSLVDMLKEKEINVMVITEWSDHVPRIIARATFVVLSEDLLKDFKALDLSSRLVQNATARVTALLLQPERKDLLVRVSNFESCAPEIIFEGSAHKLYDDVFKSIF